MILKLGIQYNYLNNIIFSEIMLHQTYQIYLDFGNILYIINFMTLYPIIIINQQGTSVFKYFTSDNLNASHNISNVISQCT